MVAEAATGLPPTTDPTLRALQRLRSPLSNDEWNKHLVVHDMRPHKSDAESLYIHALPQHGNPLPPPHPSPHTPLPLERPSKPEHRRH